MWPFNTANFASKLKHHLAQKWLVWCLSDPKATSERLRVPFLPRSKIICVERKGESPRPHLNLDMICYAKLPAEMYQIFVVVHEESPQLLLGTPPSQSIVIVHGGHKLKT